MLAGDGRGSIVANTNSSMMFFNFKALTTINGAELLDMSNVEKMDSLFGYCNNLSYVNTSKWNTSSLKNAMGTFAYCSSLESIDVSDWNMSNTTTISKMFQDCTSLKELDLSGWNPVQTSNMSQMFYNCSSLATIYVSDNWTTESVTSSNNMFYGCSSLVGGQNTAYADTTIDFAHIDGGIENPGYFTDIANKPSAE